MIKAAGKKNSWNLRRNVSRKLRKLLEPWGDLTEQSSQFQVTLGEPLGYFVGMKITFIKPQKNNSGTLKAALGNLRNNLEDHLWNIGGMFCVCRKVFSTMLGSEIPEVCENLSGMIARLFTDGLIITEFVCISCWYLNQEQTKQPNKKDVSMCCFQISGRSKTSSKSLKGEII